MIKIKINNKEEPNDDIISQQLKFLEPIKDTLSIMFNKLFEVIEADSKDYYSKKIKKVFKFL